MSIHNSAGDPYTRKPADILIERLKHYGRQYDQPGERPIVPVPWQDRDIVASLIQEPTPIELVGYRGTGKSLAMARAVELVNEKWARAEIGNNEALPSVAFLISLPELQRAVFPSIRTSRFGQGFLPAEALWQNITAQVIRQATKLKGECRHPGRLAAMESFVGLWPQRLVSERGSSTTPPPADAERYKGAGSESIFSILGLYTIVIDLVRGVRDFHIAGPSSITNTLRAAATALDRLADGGSAYMFIDDYSECDERMRHWIKRQIDELYAISLNNQNPIRLRLAGYPSHRGTDYGATRVYSDFFTRQVYGQHRWDAVAAERRLVDFFASIVLSEARILDCEHLFPSESDLFWARIASLVGANPRRFGDMLFRARDSGWDGASTPSEKLISSVSVGHSRAECRQPTELLTTLSRKEHAGLMVNKAELDAALRKWTLILSHLREMRLARPVTGTFDLLIIPDHSDWRDADESPTPDPDVKSRYLKPLREVESLINAGYLFPVKVLLDPEGHNRRLLLLGVTDQMRVAAGLLGEAVADQSWLAAYIQEQCSDNFDEFWNEKLVLSALRAVEHS